MQPSKDCVQKTLKRLEDKIQGKVLNQIMYSMNTSDRIMQHRTSTALARLGREQDLKTIFIDRKGLDILISILTDTTRDPTTLREAAGALTCRPACPLALLCGGMLHLTLTITTHPHAECPQLAHVHFLCLEA